jgi:hypothetical protein
MRGRHDRFRLIQALMGSMLLLLSLHTVATAQPPRETRGRALEVEGLFGYTGVDIEKWARVRRVHARDQESYGANLRLFVVHLGSVYTGFEVGSQRMLQYTLLTRTSDFTSTRLIHTVVSQHVGVVARFQPRPRISVDAGGGFRFLDETSLPATHLAVRYRLFGRRGWSVPLGVRLDMILDDYTTAVPMSFATGFFIKL